MTVYEITFAALALVNGLALVVTAWLAHRERLHTQLVARLRA